MVTLNKTDPCKSAYDCKLIGIDCCGNPGFFQDVSARFNVKNFKAKGDGITDDSQAFQNTVNAAIISGYLSIFIPISRGERYRIAETITIESSGFELLGDAPVINGGDGGYIFADPNIPCIFDYGNSRTDIWSNQFSMSRIRFFSTLKTQTVLKFSMDNDGPHRGVLIDKVSASGFDNVILFACSPGHISSATVVIKDSNLNGNNHVANAQNAVTGLAVIDSQIEVCGSLICGNFDGHIDISGNMLESSHNAIDIDADSPEIRATGNYFELNTGDFLVRVKCGNSNSIVKMGPNTIRNVLTTDIYNLEGVLKIFDQEDQVSGRFSALTFSGAWTTPGSKLKGNIYVDSMSGGAAGYCDPSPLNDTPESGARNISLSDNQLSTKWGRSNTGVEIGGCIQNFHDLIIDYAADDFIVVCALAKIFSGSIPYFDTYSENYSAVGVNCSQLPVDQANSWAWSIMYAARKAQCGGSVLKLRFGADGILTETDKKMYVAAIGAYVVHPSEFHEFNGAQRVPVMLFNPFL